MASPNTNSTPLSDYLARLEHASQRLPHGHAVALREEISAELSGLSHEALAARIAELGEPESVAAAALAAAIDADLHPQNPLAPPAPVQPAPRPLAETRGYATTAAVVFGLGGILLPIVGWIIGCVLVGTSKLWRTSEKALAIAGPLAVSAVLLSVLWVAGLPGQRSASAGPGAAANPLLPAGYDLLWSSVFIMFVVVVPLTALWLGLRLRNRPLPTADSRP